MKNFMKKFGAVVLSLIVAVSLLAGCGTKAADPADDASTDTWRKGGHSRGVCIVKRAASEESLR